MTKLGWESAVRKAARQGGEMAVVDGGNVVVAIGKPRNDEKNREGCWFEEKFVVCGV
jgi:hypothetical protein